MDLEKKYETFERDITTLLVRYKPYIFVSISINDGDNDDNNDDDNSDQNGMIGR